MHLGLKGLILCHPICLDLPSKHFTVCVCKGVLTVLLCSVFVEHSLQSFNIFLNA